MSIALLICGVLIGALCCVCAALCHFVMQHHRELELRIANANLHAACIDELEAARFNHNADLDALAKREGIERYGKGKRT